MHGAACSAFPLRLWVCALAAARTSVHHVSVTASGCRRTPGLSCMHVPCAQHELCCHAALASFTSEVLPQYELLLRGWRLF